MQSIFTTNRLSIQKALGKFRFIITTVFLLAGLSFNNFTKAQTSPADCKLGCTSNDVQIQTAYLSDISGNKLPANFVCPISGNATVYLTLELTTKTPRVGVVIYANVKNFTPPSTIGSLITTISQCFGTTLNQPTNKVTFSTPFNWHCGSPIVLTDVFIGWGTGNTNFCTGSGFQCPATSSKCYSLPPGQYIPIQTPTANPASATLCSTVPNGTTAVFNLTSLNSTVQGSQTNVTVTWYTDAALTNLISNPSSYTSATGNVYAKVASNTDPSVFSSSTVTLTVNPTPAAPTLGKVDNCDGTSTITATGLVSGATLTWSDGGTGNPRTVTTTTALTVTQTVNGCTSAASNSVTPAPKTTPTAPNVGVVNNCDGSSDLTASNFTGSLLWSNEATTTSIHVTVGGIYTVSQTVNGCTSLAGSGTAAPKSTPLAPAICVTQPSLCGPATGSVTVTSPIGSGFQYSVDNGTTWQTSNIFNNLAAGSVSGIKVQNSDGCISSAVSCDASNCTNQAISMVQPSIQIADQTTVKAYPNPFNNTVKFVVQASKSGNGRLDLFNLMGQKIKTVYQGFVPAGVNNFELNLPQQRNGNLIYRFVMDNKSISGKLIQLHY